MNQIDDVIALDVVIITVRAVGNLFPKAANPIRPQDKLESLRIKTALQVEAIRERIIDKLPKLQPPFKLNKEFLRNIDTSTQVGTIAAIIVSKAEEIEVIA